MIRLRKILLSNYLYIGLLIIISLFLIYSLNQKKTSKYNSNIKEIDLIVTNYVIDGNKLNIELKGRENLIGNYYFKTKKEKKIFLNNINLGDKIKVIGNLKKPNKNTTEDLFNYKKYLERNNIFYITEIEEIYLLKKNTNIFYSMKNIIFKRTTNPYLKTFILGDTSLINKNIIRNYQEIGISHLFAISGMHISLLSAIILKLLKKFNIRENNRYLIVSIILIFYLLLVDFSPSVLRAVLFFILFSINKIYYFYIKPVNIFIVVVFISLLINPKYIFDIAFLYSFSISFSLIVLGDYINQYKNYFIKLLITSLISFIVSIPITIYSFNQINILSIIYNIFYVPLVSIIVFPLSLITFFIPPLEIILNITIKILEYSSNIFTNIDIFKFIFCNINYIFYVIYVTFIIIFLRGLVVKKYYYLLPLLFLILIHYFCPYFKQEDYLIMLDIGQGDSILLHSKNKNVLIDTGGNMTYNDENWKKRQNNYSIVENITIPYLKKSGIKKLDYLILTHGDYDHLGEAKQLIKRFQIDRILINEGNINYLEKDIVDNFNNVEKASSNYYFEVGNLKFLSLNNDLKEENDSSLIFYVESINSKILLMGDASIKSEENILNKYNLKKIDILKVGHHGSRTSSSEKFLKKIKPDLALISAGKDNKFNHPHQEILQRFNKLKIDYLVTSIVGSIKINL